LLHSRLLKRYIVTQVHRFSIHERVWRRSSGIAFCAFLYYHQIVTTITCKIPDKISAHLSALARHRRVPKSQIVREALAASFRKAKSNVSAFDLMKDVCGIVKGGPKDYASHRRHLKGFGEA
jgi:predicted DNA-binding protein